MTDDERVFGAGAWVYCRQHMIAHQTGWCGVSVTEKLGLGIDNSVGSEVSQAYQALEKCREFGLALHSHKPQSATHVATQEER